MQKNKLVPHLTYSARVRLSPRGHSTEAAYRSRIICAEGPTRRKAFEFARSEWALNHGLQPDDGAYLSELRITALTVKELGEALAICGQTREMVSKTVGRLLSQGFLLRVAKGEATRAGPSFKKAQQELVAAEVELESVNREFNTDGAIDRRMITMSLQQAISRVVAARRFLESLSCPS